MALQKITYPLSLVTWDKIPSVNPSFFSLKEDLYDIYDLFLEMERICIQEKGLGLSAVQLGVPVRAFVTCEEGKKSRYFYDCDYRGIGSKRKSTEGCLSLKNEKGKSRLFVAERFNRVRVTGYEVVYRGLCGYRKVDEVVYGARAILYQHEIDHQKGILISDIGQEI